MDPENPEGVLDLEDEDLEQDETPEEEQQDDEPGDDEPEDETLIGFDDEEPIQAEPENSVVRRLREQLETEKKLRKEAQSKVPKVEAGPKPTLESCDYDEDKYDAAILAWNERKVAEAAAAQPSATQSEEARQDFDTDLAEYAQQKTKLARPDFDVAETIVTGKLNEVQQSVLVMASKNKAALIYALGKNPERLDTLASIQNPIKLAIAVSDMERSLKVQARRKAPEPEPRMKGGTPNNESGDKKLERLEKDADRTGDRTALLAYKRSLKKD